MTIGYAVKHIGEGLEIRESGYFADSSYDCYENRDATEGSIPRRR